MKADTYRCGVLTISDRGAAGERQDTSGPALRELLISRHYSVIADRIVPDRIPEIQDILIEWADQLHLDLILTTGGTGLSPSDVTPEATIPLIHRQIPGICEAMRSASRASTINAILSRGVAGCRNQCLIINLPGSQKGAVENLSAVIDALPHALYKIKGGMADCGGDEGGKTGKG
ncbi:MAG: MogA/MoaB family molybdenum cofactor biosynthesis protein [Proteobacteria bacterium]|nr:MogA/MoaB family molybdenum cofactor biosynthesis protein [Pseudomonadota bacterium]MBU1688611.1 MogA/MoaB family molybdenum cofactor biosynthesis protein [Pseudomonadota bacterium]